MAMPGIHNPVSQEVEFLKNQKVSIIINLTEENYSDPVYRDAFQVFDFPVSEYAVPTEEQMDQLVDLYRVMRDQDRMAVHCRAGVGRTGTALSCILGMVEGLTGNEAMRKIRSTRTGSVETTEQAWFVRKYLGW